MATKSISSTEAQNNFGQVLNDATNNRTRYIVERHGIPQIVILSFDDFTNLLDSESERKQMYSILTEVQPQYSLGRVLGSESSPKK